MEHATGNWKKARGSSPIHCQLQTFQMHFQNSLPKMMLNCSNKTIHFYIAEKPKRSLLCIQIVGNITLYLEAIC